MVMPAPCPDMLTSSDQSLPLTPKHSSPAISGPRGSRGPISSGRSSLSLPEPEAWRTPRTPSPVARQGLAQGSRSCSLQVPRTVPECLGLPPRAASFDVSPYGGDESPGSVSPHSMLRRRGGLVDQRDVVRAHEAHKIQSTPQARRKEWE